MPTILIVEDAPDIIQLLDIFFRNNGFSTVLAHDGAAALAAFQAALPNLILLDMMLPDMDGIDVCRAIRAQSQVPIIVLTARTEKENILAAFASGADDYIVKPFDAEIVLARVHAVLKRSRPTR